MDSLSWIIIVIILVILVFFVWIIVILLVNVAFCVNCNNILNILVFNCIFQYNIENFRNLCGSQYFIGDCSIVFWIMKKILVIVDV